jgi:hypothetical protein
VLPLATSPDLFICELDVVIPLEVIYTALAQLVVLDIVSPDKFLFVLEAV